MTDPLKTEELKDARQAANESAYTAIMRLVELVQKALGGERLRGLPNLTTSSTSPVRAAPVRVAFGNHLMKPTTTPKNGLLVLTERGELGMYRNGAIDPVQREELRAEDARQLADTVAEVTERHLTSIDKTINRFRAMERLSRKLCNVLEID